jgi:hydroxyacylglutathione hydrolase
MNLTVVPVVCLEDNYSYLLIGPGGEKAVVVDPGDAGPVRAALAERQCEPEAVLLTHHHLDHVAGVSSLCSERRLPVYCSRIELDLVAGASRSLRDGEEVRAAGLAIRALHVPGHTLGHLVYLCEGSLFTGDTLFLGGCGRLFEGTDEQMFDSLYGKILSLPAQTRIYPGHEYTVYTRSFCLSIEPGNEKLREVLEEAKTLESRGLPTVPGVMQTERDTNVFLRCREEAVIRAVRDRYPHAPSDPLSVFRCLRSMMDAY